MKDLYGKWINGQKIALHVGELVWEIFIQKEDDICFLGYGWVKFVVETGLKVDDVLYFSRNKYKDLISNIHVCIIASREIG